MAYGRLDVYWSDGKFESFPLEASTVSVGRSSGCTIVLETDTISRYHFSITNDNDEIKISDMDSANGTFVDGVKLENNESRPLHGGEEIQIGHLRMIYHYADDMPTVMISDDEEADTQRFERDEVGFKVDVYPPPISVPPGAHTTIEVSLTNTSAEDKQFTIEVEGLPESWVRINRPTLLARPDEMATILINIKPVRHFESKPGDYIAQITIALKDDPEQKIVAHANVTILPFGGFGMALGNRVIGSYEPFKLHLHNQGSAGLPLYIMGRSKDNALKFGIRQPNVVLAPGQRMVVQGDIKATHRRLIGKPTDHSFDIMVRSRDDAGFLVAECGHYINSAILPRWAAAGVGLALLGALVLVTAFILLVALSVTPKPEIAAFSVSSMQIARGDLLTLEWTATDAESYSALVNGEPVAENIPGDATSTQIVTGDYDGDISVILVAFNKDERDDSQPVIVNVYEPLIIEYFEALPSSTLVRNVVQQITIRWRVNGATTTRVEGLDAFSNSFSAEPSYGTEGTLADIPGVPQDDFSVTLFAVGEVGNTLEQVINIDVIDAQCTATDDNYTLYAQPDLASNVVSTVPADVPISVDRRDETGGWLRAQLDGGVSAWGVREGLECADNFNPDSLLIEVAETTSTPTPTPTDDTTDDQ
jgi:hypothetical protein